MGLGFVKVAIEPAKSYRFILLVDILRHLSVLRTELLAFDGELRGLSASQDCWRYCALLLNLLARFFKSMA